MPTVPSPSSLPARHDFDTALPGKAGWQVLRRQLRTRQGARCAQRRFRQDPDAYLSALEDALLRASLPT